MKMNLLTMLPCLLELADHLIQISELKDQRAEIRYQSSEIRDQSKILINYLYNFIKMRIRILSLKYSPKKVFAVIQLKSSC